ncbi:hypothetical protein [Alteromonas phage JH01]|nr:hypothetical protein [Alteromonas phage JH01]
MATFTKAEIAEAKKRLLSNVLRVREGNTWVEYGSAEALRQAIKDAESDVAGTSKPRGTRLVSVSSGYN